MIFWLFLIVASIGSVGVAIIFRMLPSVQKDNIIMVLFWNYITAFLISFPFLIDTISTKDLVQLPSEGIILLVVLGIIFVVNFFAYSKSVNENSISTSVLFTRISLIVPVLSGVVLLNEEISSIQIFGLVLAFGALIISSFSYKSEQSMSSPIWLIILFVLTGVGDSILAFSEKTGLSETQITQTIFLVCAIVLFPWYLRNAGKDKITNVFWGLSLGLANFTSVYFILRALKIGASFVIFPTVNILIIVLSTIAGITFFREIISKKMKLVIALGICSLVLMN